MNRILALLSFAVALGVIVFVFPEGVTGVLLGTVCTLGAMTLINRLSSDYDDATKNFLRQILICGLLFRVILASLIFVFQWQSFLGPDAGGFNDFGAILMRSWTAGSANEYQTIINNSGVTSGGSDTVGWGMPYLVGFIYLIVGENNFAVQVFNSVLGAATAPLAYFCARNLFNNDRIARLTAILTAFFPSLVLWSAQALKDGIILFCMVLAVYAMLELRKKFSYQYLILLGIGASGVVALRFYIFFAAAVAILSGFVIDAQTKLPNVVRRVMILSFIAFALTAVGIIRNPAEYTEKYDLAAVNNFRQDMADRADSGYGRDLDVSTPMGALAALPIGFTYFMFAPFPWQVSNFRQAVPLPEVFIWWAMTPFTIIGLWFALTKRMRQSIPIVLLTLLLSVIYSLLQGNVGTAYRQRAQVLVFYFIFTAVGFEYIMEKTENSRLKKRKQIYNQRSIRTNVE